MTLIECDDRRTELPIAAAPGSDLWLSAGDAEKATGWTLKPEGLCQGDVCVPVPPSRRAEFVRGGDVNMAAFWRHMGRPAARDEKGEIWVLGAGARERAAALQTLEAPDFELPDTTGKVHRLSDYRGKKVLLVSWASW